MEEKGTPSDKVNNLNFDDTKSYYNLFFFSSYIFTVYKLILW